MEVKVNWVSLILLCYCSLLFGFMSSVILQQEALPYIGAVTLFLGLIWRWIAGPIIEVKEAREARENNKGDPHE